MASRSASVFMYHIRPLVVIPTWRGEPALPTPAVATIAPLGIGSWSVWRDTPLVDTSVPIRFSSLPPVVPPAPALRPRLSVQ